MKKGLFHLCGLAVLLGLMTAVSAQESEFPPVPSAQVVAHRGFSAIAPENTLSSFREAVNIGAQGCECDVYQTSDGVLFTNHDGSLKRCGGVDVKPGDITFEELRKLDAGSWKGEQFKGEKFPTLREMLELLEPTPVIPVIEIKADGIEDKVIAEIRAMKMEKRVIIIDFSAARVKKCREIAPEIPAAWLVSFDPQKMTADEMSDKIEKTLADCNTNVVDMIYTNALPEALDRLNAKGIYVMIWTVDNPADMQKYLDLGVKSITTNNPDKLLNLMK